MLDTLYKTDNSQKTIHSRIPSYNVPAQSLADILVVRDSDYHKLQLRYDCIKHNTPIYLFIVVVGLDIVYDRAE